MLCAITTLLITVSIYGIDSTFAIFVDGASFRSVDTYYDDDIFVTTNIRDFEDCVRSCERTTSCVFVNYRVRGNICSSTHYIGDSSVSVHIDRIPGYGSWIKSSTNTSTSTLCLNCNSTQSCTFDDTQGVCEIFACGPPPITGSMEVTGNMYKVADKLTYKCSSQSASYTLVCLQDGHWDGIHDTCTYPGYTEYSLPDGTRFLLRIYDTKETQQTAMTNCQTDGATLTTVLCLDKLQLFRTLLAYKSVDYWVDAERYGTEDLVWFTSDGRSQPMDVELWEAYSHGSSDNCARIEEESNWRLNDHRCNDRHAYICEIPLA